MAEKKFNFANGVKYDDHVSPTSAADSFAAAYSLNASNFTPFPMPYYNPGIFFNQNYQPTMQNFAGYPFWHPFASTHTADYLFNITALQNMQAMATANHCGESFYDVLNKISQTQSCGGGDEKDFVPKFCTNGLNQKSCSPAQTPLCQTVEATSNRPSSSRTYASTPFANQLSSSSSPSSTGSPHSNLVTLAEVASSLTPEVFSKSSIKRNKTPSSNVETNINVKNNRKRISKLDNNNCEIKVPKVETMEEQKEDYRVLSINESFAENNHNQFVNNNDDGDKTPTAFKQHWDQTSQNIISTMNANNLKLDQNLLNASAIAWSALTEQLLAAAERRDMIMNERTPKENNKEKIKPPNEIDCTSEMSTNKTKAATKPKRAYRRRNAVTQPGPIADVPSTANLSAVDIGGRDLLMDETINEIIGIVCLPETSQKVKRQRKNVVSSTNHVADVSSTTLNAQMDDIFSNEALDLTIKKQEKMSNFPASKNFEFSQSCQNFISLPRQKNAVAEPFGCGVGKSKECKTGNKKRRTAETECVRLPLNKGWRRQTCVRTISASGIRGDVIYYAPCGRRLASCGEVLRYLKKLPDADLNREHFSFSSKVLVGEFLEVKATGNKNFTEDEILEYIQSLQRSKNSTGIQAAGSKSCRLNKSADDLDVSIQNELEPFLETKSSLDVSGFSSTNAESFIDSSPSSSNFEQMDEIEKAVCFCVTDLVNTVSKESFQMTNNCCEHSDDRNFCSNCYSLCYNRDNNIQANYSLPSMMNGVQIRRLEPLFNSTDVNSNNFTSSYDDECSSKYDQIAKHTSSSDADTVVNFLKMDKI